MTSGEKEAPVGSRPGQRRTGADMEPAAQEALDSQQSADTAKDLNKKLERRVKDAGRAASEETESELDIRVPKPKVPGN